MSWGYLISSERKLEYLWYFLTLQLWITWRQFANKYLLNFCTSWCMWKAELWSIFSLLEQGKEMIPFLAVSIFPISKTRGISLWFRNQNLLINIEKCLGRLYILSNSVRSTSSTRVASSRTRLPVEQEISSYLVSLSHSTLPTIEWYCLIVGMNTKTCHGRAILNASLTSRQLTFTS